MSRPSNIALDATARRLWGGVVEAPTRAAGHRERSAHGEATQRMEGCHRRRRREDRPKSGAAAMSQGAKMLDQCVMNAPEPVPEFSVGEGGLWLDFR